VTFQFQQILLTFSGAVCFLISFFDCGIRGTLERGLFLWLLTLLPENKRYILFRG